MLTDDDDDEVEEEDIELDRGGGAAMVDCLLETAFDGPEAAVPLIPGPLTRAPLIPGSFVGDGA